MNKEIIEKNIEKNEKTKQELVQQYVKKMLGEVKIITDKDCIELEKNGVNFEVIKNLVGIKKDGTEEKAFKVLILPNQEEMDEILLTCELSNISIKDLMLKKYYIATMNKRKVILKKYTTVVRDFKKTYPDLYITFPYEKQTKEGLVCSIQRLVDGKFEVYLESYCSYDEMKTTRSKQDGAKSKAFKEILRYNFPQFVETYDEFDMNEIPETQKQVEENDLSKSMKKELLNKLENGEK